MSTDTDPGTAASAEHADEEHEHPSDGFYVQIAVILGVITAAEVALPYIADVEGAVLWAMLAMMVAKFAMVAGYFMHLKYDSVLLRRIFVMGLVLAVAVYVAALATFEFWG